MTKHVSAASSVEEVAAAKTRALVVLKAGEGEAAAFGTGVSGTPALSRRRPSSTETTRLQPSRELWTASRRTSGGHPWFGDDSAMGA